MQKNPLNSLTALVADLFTYACLNILTIYF
jgi:hypothetical protein